MQRLNLRILPLLLVLSALAPAPAAANSQPWVVRMNQRLASERGRARYRLRQQTVEPVFGVIKAVMGFRQFLLRGIDKLSGEWTLVCLAYNCKRLHRLMQLAPQ